MKNSIIAAVMLSCALLFTPVAKANPILASTGVLSDFTCPVPAYSCSGQHAAGNVATIDGAGYSQGYALADFYTLGSGTGSAPCTTTGHFWINYTPSGGVVFDDESATIITYGNGTCPDSMSAIGVESGMPYVVHVTNPHFDEYGRNAFDYLLIRPGFALPSGGSMLNGEDPFRRTR